MNADIFHKVVVPACMRLFPEHYNTPEARAQILTIGLQESRFEARQQLVGGVKDWWKSVNAPANGFMQFELIGVREVLFNRVTAKSAERVCAMFSYPPDPVVIHKALVHNDVLSAAFARLALWRVREPLPRAGDPDEAWRQYIQIWAPGKPRPEKWEANYVQAWKVVLSADN